MIDNDFKSQESDYEGCKTSKTRVSRKKFFEAVQYISWINRLELGDLDFSEFTDKDLTKAIKDWKYSGMNNRDFILLVLTRDKEIK